MAAKALPSPEVLRQLLQYDEETGRFTWTSRGQPAWDALYAGKAAFTADSGMGYRVGKVADISVRAHRVAWAIYYGEWPSGAIDHINGIRSDNRIANLRCVSAKENNRNARRPKDNTTGIVGVYRTKFGWSAQIAGRHLQRDKCFGVAVKIRKAAERQLGFHPNHGRTA